MEILQPNSQAMAIAEDIICRYPLATLIIYQAKQPLAWHLPLTYKKSRDNQQSKLLGHISGKNPMLQQGLDLTKATECKAIFVAEHGYVSPTWHNHIKVPTWDYCAVHVEAHIQQLAAENITNNMQQQIAAMEPQWQLEQLNPKLRQQMLNAIKVVELDISSISAHFKMSQNKPEVAKQAIMDHFNQQDQTKLVEQYQTIWRNS